VSTEEVFHNDAGVKARYRHDTYFIWNVGLDRLGLTTFINDSIRRRQEHSSLCNREIIQSEGRSEQILVASRGSAGGKKMSICGETWPAWSQHGRRQRSHNGWLLDFITDA